MSQSNSKVRVAALSIVSNTTLIILKIVAGLLSGSVSIISEAIHSGMDLIASVIAFFSVKYAANPADEMHPYGHGKIENISGVTEGLLIFVAAFLIIVEAVKKIFHPAEISETPVAIAVMLFSAVVNALVSQLLYKTAKKEDSIALEADALHLKTDVYTSLGVGIGLLLITFTKTTVLDPIVAILVAMLIVKEAWSLTTSAFKPLLDAKLPNEEEAVIKEVLKKYESRIINYHALRTRKAGHIRFIELHITVQEEQTVKDSHDLSELIEQDLENALKNVNVHIHIEPGKKQ